MPNSLADILESNQERFMERWSQRAGKAEMHDNLGVSCYTGIVTLLRGDNSAEWRADLRRTGVEMAEKQVQVRDIVATALDFVQTLRGLVRETGGDDPLRVAALEEDISDIQAEMLGEMLSGYSEDQERKARELQLALDEVNGLHKIISAANSSLDFQAVIDQVVQTVSDVMHVTVCSLFTYEPQLDLLVLRATTGLSHDMVGKFKLHLGEGVTGWAGRTGKPVALSNAWNDARFVHVPYLGEEGMRAMLAVPIVLFTKLKLVGVISLQTMEERTFGEREIKFLETVAGEISIAIENARLYGETDARLHQKVVELTTLQGVSATIAATLNLRQVLNLIATEAARLVNVDAAIVYELHEEKLVPVAGYGFGEDDVTPPWLPTSTEMAQRNGNGRPALGLIEEPRRGPAVQYVRPPSLASLPEEGEELVANTVQTGRTLFLGRGSAASMSGLASISQPARYSATPPTPYACEFCVPLAAPRGVLGAICLFSREERHFTAEQVSLLEAFAREGAIAMENAKLYEETRHGLEVKTLLLREMHHRVRNNLQRTASLLRMQSQRLPSDSEALSALQESIIRIQSIARVHDLLSREQIGVTDVSSVANLAIEVVSNTLARPDQRIHWRAMADHIPLSSQEAFPMTLLLTELLSNAVLHGFSSRDEGHVTISACLQDGALKIGVHDDGRGLASDFNVQRDAHLGLEVVRRLGEQELGGVLKIEPAESGTGTVATLIVPYYPPQVQGDASPNT